MLKTAATYATLLGVVSIIYYVAFWWSFDINVIPFFKIEDLLLGIIFPLRYSGLYSISSLILIAIFSVIIPSDIVTSTPEGRKFNSLNSEIENLLRDKSKISNNLALIDEKMEEFNAAYKVRRKQLKKRIRLALLGLYVVALVALVFFINEPYNKSLNAILTLTLTAPIGFSIAQSSDLPENLLDISDKNKAWISSVDLFLIMLLVFLPISAITTGYSEAQAIIMAKRFKYILAKDMPSSAAIGSNRYVTYLGVINEKFVLSDSLNTETIIIDKEELPVLKIHSFDYNEKNSIELFRKLANAPAKSKSLSQDSASSKGNKIQNSKQGNFK
jgi:hypothetical protein